MTHAATAGKPADFATRLTPAAAWLERAACLHAQGELQAAADAFDRAAELGASTFALHLNRSVIAANLGDPVTALHHALAAAALRPESLVAQINAAIIEGPARGYETALARLDATAVTHRDDPRLQRARAQTLLKLKRFAAALSAAETSLALEPHDTLGQEFRIAALKGLGRDAEAADTLRNADIAGLGGRLLVHRAVLELEAGRRDGVPDVLRTALAREPDLACAWFNLAEIGACDPAGSDIAAMQRLVDDEARNANDRIVLHFALGKALLAANRHAAAFAHFARGNAGKRQQLDYDVVDDVRVMRELARTFDAAALARVDPRANQSERPVFVLGMPRSGTSLVEQLLASHPAVYGAGELPFIPQLAAQCRSLDVSAWPPVAERYLEAAGAHAGDAMRVIDKLPLNFAHAGFIHMLFPNARIIHCRRNALDTAVSCFFTLFDEAHEFSYDLTDLGRFVRAYSELMEHWRSALPSNRFLDIDYEALVAAPEAEARRLTAFCGLPWDPAVLRFHRNERVVRTASKLQVRRPIYRTSVDRAQAFGAALDSLRAALAGEPST